MMRTLLALLLLCIAMSLSVPCLSQSNEGKDFWLGFMEHRDRGANTMVVMITSRLNTQGSISMPRRNFSQEFVVEANEVTLVQLPSYAETVGSEFINENAIHITSEEDVSVYMHQYFGMRSEASVVLPSISLGNTYYVMTYTGVGNNFMGGPFPPEFLIVASQDETTVSYTLSGNTQNGKQAGQTYSVTLNKGEVYQVRADNWLSDLTGTYIEGDKDFALFAGTPWSQVPLGCTAMDNLLEQMYPISTWGTRYVASSFFGTSSDLFRIVASVDNTEVRIEGQRTFETSLNAGEYYDFESSMGSFIESDFPISVAQFITGSNCNGGVGDPSMVILNTVEQIRDTVTLFNSGFFAIDQNYINVICKTAEADLVFIDGQNVVDRGFSFIPIGEEAVFSYAAISTSIGAHTLYTEGCGIIAMAYGYGDIESYAYSGGASFVDINENPIPEGGCLNDTILFNSGLPPDRYNIDWDLGNGSRTNLHEFTYLYANLGTYPLSVIVEDICFGDIDTLYQDVLISLRQDLAVGPDQSGCEGSEIILSAIDLEGASFEWSGPNDYVSKLQFPIIESAKLEDAGIYEAVGNISGCKTIPLDVGVEVYENPLPDLGADQVICKVDDEAIIVTVGDYAAFLWQDGATGSEYFIKEEGSYIVEVLDDKGCIGVDSLIIVSQCPTRVYVPNSFSPNGDNVNDEFGVWGIEIISMSLSVYDRWGQLVFESSNAESRWDGTGHSGSYSTGEYLWILRYAGFTEDASLFQSKKKGSVLLMR
ncbi:MAG: gliding motility-associated-like protein [Saprospiraceae bacterium]|jgi:gliding motility-associated-like protein